MKIVSCNNKEDRKVVIDGIVGYNDSQTDRVLEKLKQPIELITKNKLNEVVGGVFGYINCYGGFKINTLWVSENVRGEDIGTKLLKSAEIKAKELGATVVILDTFSFQAEDFYIKNGYSVFGRIEGFPKEKQEFVFLKKKLK